MGVLFSFNILGLKDIKTKGCGRRKAEQEGVKRVQKRNMLRKQKQNK